MGCFSNSAPAQPNYGNVTRDTLKAQVDLAPAQYASEAKYQPLYTDLALGNLNTMVNGTAGGTPGVTGIISGARAHDIQDVATLGPQARAAMLAANPDNAELLAKLNSQANEGLDAGSMLDADQQRAMQQESRAAFAARGMGGGNAIVADELLRQFNLGQTLLRQRQAFAQSVIGDNQSVVGDPFAQILGRNSGAVPVAQNQQAGPSLFNPQAGLGMAQSNYGTLAQFSAASPTVLETAGQIVGMASNGIGGTSSSFL